MKKVLITGGAGFIGSHISERLLQNYEVIILDNLSSGCKENLPSNGDYKLYKLNIEKDNIE